VSDACGVGQYFTAAGSSLRGSFAVLPRFSASFARGVGQNAAASCSLACTFAPFGRGFPSHDSFASVRHGVLSLLDALGVGHNPDAIASVRGAKGGSWYAMPFRIIPDRGQVSENAVQPSTKQSCDVLHDDISGLKLANKTGKLRPEPTSLAINASTFSGKADVLTREAADDALNGKAIGSKQSCGEGSHVIVNRHSWPVFRENFLRFHILLAERDGFESAGAFKPQVEAANACEQRQHLERLSRSPHPHHPLPNPFNAACL
jgi:hypothetical protein